MANVGSTGIVRYEETFATDTIGSAGDGIGWIITNDSSDTPWARAVNTSRGLHAVGTLTTTDNNRLEFLSDTFLFTGQTGHSSVECLLQLNVVTTIAIFFGFNDAVTGPSNIIPVALSGTTFTLNAADGCIGILLDADADNDVFHAFWGNGGVKTPLSAETLRMGGMAPTASKWFYMKVSMQDMGTTKGVRASFLVVDHNGASIEKEFDTSVDRDLPLNFYLGLENRDSIEHVAYLKSPAWEQTIETN